MSEKINVTLSPERLQVAPGESAITTATIKNTGDVVEAYSITVEGVGPQWCTLSVSSASLFPSDEERVQITVQPPKDSSSRAGTYNAVVRVTSNRDPAVETTIQFPIDVGRFLLFDVELSPKKAKGRKGSYKVNITNNGNVPTTYTFAGQDPEDACRFHFKQSSVAVEPGAAAQVPLIVDPKKKPFTGRARTHNFKITVTSHASEAGETKSVEAQFQCKPLIPTWALAVASVAVVAVIAVVLVLFLVILAGKAPVISGVTADPSTVGTSGDSTITCAATDGDGDPLTYVWSADTGTISGSGSSVTWTAPSAAGEYTVSVTVDDGTGRSANGSVAVTAVVTTGTIEVDSDPAGARVYLDGQDTGGTAQFDIEGVSEGDHTVRLTYEHYKDYEETVTVTAGETIEVDAEMEYAPEQTMTLQPNPTDGKDAFVASDDPAVNYGANLFLSISRVSWQTNQFRTYIQFDLSSIPSTAVVTDASLHLFYGLAIEELDTPAGLYRVTSAWDESTVTWNNQPDSWNAPEATNTVPPWAIGSFVSWQVDSLVQSWIDGSVDNYGAMLRDTDEATAETAKGFSSSDNVADPAYRPKLEITYYDPAP